MNPLQILLESINKLFSAVRKNGALYSLWSVVVFILLYTFIINPININDLISQINTKEDKKHNESVDKRLLADEAIPEILDKMRFKYGVDRLCLMEMHNSTTNINEVSFLFMSLTYESIDNFNDSIPYVTEQYQQQRTSEYTNVIKECHRKGYLYLNIEEAKKDAKFVRIARKVEINGAKSMLFLPLFNGRRMDGMLVFSSTKGDFDYQNILINTNKSVAKIKSLIFNDLVL